MSKGTLTGWSLLLVGHQWPNLASLGFLSAAAESRQSNSRTAESYADELGTIRKTRLNGLAGIAADAIKGNFELAEAISREVARKNRAKSDAYRGAQSAVRQLRDDLASIADEGEKRIQEVLGSHEPLPLKTALILDIVVQAQSQANIAAARHSNNVIDTIQRVLDAEDLGISARHYAAENGAVLTEAFASTNTEQLQSHVQTMVGTSTKPPLTPAGSDTSVDKSTVNAPNSSHAFTEWGADQRDLTATADRPTLQDAEIVSSGSSSGNDLQATATQAVNRLPPIESAIEYGGSTSVVAPVQLQDTSAVATSAASAVGTTVGFPSQMATPTPQSTINSSTAGNAPLSVDAPSQAVPFGGLGGQMNSPQFEAPPTC